LEISNLFNTEYFDYSNIMAAGRWIKGGVVLSI